MKVKINVILAFFTINVGIGAYFVYYKYINCGKKTASRYNHIYYAKFY